MCSFCFSYQACYAYEIIEDINGDDKCVIMNLTAVVSDIIPIISTDSIVYEIVTPLLPSDVYPNQTVCFFVIGKRWVL